VHGTLGPLEVFARSAVALSEDVSTVGGSYGVRHGPRSRQEGHSATTLFHTVGRLMPLNVAVDEVTFGSQSKLLCNHEASPLPAGLCASLRYVSTFSPSLLGTDTLVDAIQDSNSERRTRRQEVPAA